MGFFRDTRVAYSSKSTCELRGAYWLFRLMSCPTLANIFAKVAIFSLKLRLPVKRLIKATLYRQFCGGETEEDCESVITDLKKYNIKCILDYSVEGLDDDREFEDLVERMYRVIDYTQKNSGTPFVVFKPTAIGSIELYTKVSEGDSLNTIEKTEWERIENRFKKLCHHAYERGVPIMVDAEESWMQPAADILCRQMMMCYNKSKTMVYNTAQMYRTDTMDRLKNWKEHAQEHNYKVGVKIVRGAYIEKENERAKTRGYPSPICENKIATDKNFNSGLDYLLHDLNYFDVFIGTHNEYSCAKVIEIMEELNIPKDNPSVWIGQLYGMSDHISFNMSKKGYNVSKYLPFSPVKKMMPYLLRRIEENSAITGQAATEINLIKKEIKRRGGTLDSK